MIERIRSENVFEVGDNEPYAVSPLTDYAIPVHGEHRGIPCIGLEIRQDLIAKPSGQAEWAGRIANWLLPIAKLLNDASGNGQSIENTLSLLPSRSRK